MGEPLLTLRGVTKTYANTTAVDKANLSIGKGIIYGLLGPNGAGKTSIIRMITSITAPDKGTINFNGQPLKAFHKSEIGYLPEVRGLYRKMRVGEHLEYLIRLRGLSKEQARKRTLEWLEKLGLEDVRKRKVQELSKGMQQKVQFIATVAHEPKLLILDEPFSGLDPINTKLIEQEIRRMREEGATIIFSTHRMEQVEELCEEIALMNHGKVILEEQMRNVWKQFQEPVFELTHKGILKEVPHFEGCKILAHETTKIIFELADETEPNHVLKQFTELPIQITKFEQPRPRLNDIFIKLVNETQ